eukprot:g12237.t1
MLVDVRAHYPILWARSMALRMANSVTGSAGWVSSSENCCSEVAGGGMPKPMECFKKCSSITSWSTVRMVEMSRRNLDRADSERTSPEPKSSSTSPKSASRRQGER